jgi:predicted GIY-YIG superfamily endonuclease
MDPDTTTVYVLELENGKYYIGRTTNLDERVESHFNGVGSAWTRKHKPLRLLESRPNVSKFVEDACTKEYMAKYGINNVRGGSYCQVNLSSKTVEVLNSELDKTHDRCYHCHAKGHHANDCPGDDSDDDDEDPTPNNVGCFSFLVQMCCIPSTATPQLNLRPTSSSRPLPSQPLTSPRQPIPCDRCGRVSHGTNNCYATTHVDGHKLLEDRPTLASQVCGRCGRKGHIQAGCCAKTYVDGRVFKE